jgi:hypothetical protein
VLIARSARSWPNTSTVALACGKAITGITVTDEAGSLLGRWSGLMAGELYAVRANDRPRVFDLHAAMGRRRERRRSNTGTRPPLLPR